MINTIALVCTHNGEKYLKEQIDSLLIQTRGLDKICIFDFNSSDNTSIIAKRFVEEFGNVRFEKIDFAPGPAISFFIGIDRIRDSEVEDYLLYLVDQDDLWLKSKNDFVFNEYFKLKFDFAFHDVEIVDADLNTLRPNYYGGYWNVKRDFTFPSQLFANCVIGHTCVLHSDFVKVLSIPNDSRVPMHDWHIANQALLRNNYIFFEEVLSKYRQHDDNILGASKSGFGFRLKRMWSYSRVLNQYHEYLISSDLLLLRDFKPSSVLLLVRYLRPVRKLVYVFFVKFIFRL